MLSLRPSQAGGQAHGFAIKARCSLGRHRTGWQTLAPLFRGYGGKRNRSSLARVVARTVEYESALYQG